MGKIFSNEKQKGFTLVELIVVLVVLGILAAVAVPKLMDVTTDARKQAMRGALAEGVATMSVAYAKLMLTQSGNATTTQTAAMATSNLPASDDFSYTFASDGLVTVGAKAGGSVAGGSDVSKQWSKP
ncbi:MAG: prepilin-type N-terminal cleavage/methylation domain-containing protein [Syntrophobacterales bacterium]|nr:prepilin-type N-terminal cleavage/methylation domain-containing protein [Syntrophobacterales bacterium]